MDLSKQKEMLVKAGFWASAVLGVLLFLRFCLPLLWPFLLGLAIAYALRPIVSFLRCHSGITRKGASIITSVFFFAMLLVLLWLAGTAAARGLHRIGEALPVFVSDRVAPFLSELWHRGEALRRRVFQNGSPQQAQQVSEGIEQALAGMLSNLSSRFMETLTGFAKKIPAYLLAMLFTVLATVLISADYDGVARFLMAQVPQRMRDTLLEIRDFLVGTIWKIVRAYLILMAITFAYLWLGLWVAGAPKPLVMAAVTAVLDLLPVLGSGMVLVPWAVYELLGGKVFLGVGILLLWVILSIGREVLEPRIVGGQIGLHPVITLLAMYAGLKAAGFLGLLAAPVLCLLLQYLQKKGMIHLFRSA